MTRLRTTTLSLMIVGVLAAGAVGSQAYAQSAAAQPAVTTGQAPPAAGGSAEPSWTLKKWREMKAKWSQEKEKYAACKVKAKGLRGKKYWHAMWECMNA